MSGFIAPTDTQVQEVLRRILTPELRRAFFEGLRNPLWLEPLEQAGMFSNPPEPEYTDDGMVRDIYWPEIDYLIRVAPENPRLIVNILLKLHRSNNAWVRRAVFTIGAAIPAGEASRLKPLLKEWAAAGGFGWRTDPREMVDFTVHLLSGGETKAGRWIANILFRPTSAEPGSQSNMVLEDYWYEEGLPRLVEALGDDGLAVVTPWLTTYQRLHGYLTDDFDRTYLPRESIRRRSVRGHEDVGQALIEAVTRLATQAIDHSPRAAVDRLLGTRMILGRKIALCATAEALDQPGLTGDRAGDIVAVAVDLLTDNASRTTKCRIEYGELARAVARHSRLALEPLAEVLAAGPDNDVDALREAERRDDDEDAADLEERVRERVDRRLHIWLSSIGADALPAQLAPLLADLDARFGAIENPLSPADMVTSWSGPNSPISQDEMAAMSAVELIAHLESWRPTGDGWGPEPSHEGQARTLTSLLATNPQVFTGIGDLVDRLRPTYLRALIEGWEAALKAGIQLDWDQAVNVVRQILEHHRESAFPIEGDSFSDAPDYRAAKHAAVRLISDLVQPREASLVPVDKTTVFAALLIYEAADEDAWDEYATYQGESDMDPLSISLNWQWPIRVRGLVNLLSHGQDSSWYSAAKSALQFELSRIDSRGAGAAVLGQGLGRLLGADEEWVAQHATLWFGTATGTTRSQQIAFTTALSMHYYHPKLYDLLSPSMIGAIRSTEPLVEGWRGRSGPLQVIGEWVLWSLIRGHTSMSDPVAENFFQRIDARTRGEAIGQVAWSFVHAESVDDAIRDRLAEFWDSRVEHVRVQPEDSAELCKFYWFIKSAKFDPSWWLPRFKVAWQLCPELGSERYMISTALAAAAQIDPRAALDVTILLVEGREASGVPKWDLARNCLPTVIALALASQDEELQRDATQFMNRLGERGHRDLEKQVTEVLGGKVFPEE